MAGVPLLVREPTHYFRAERASLIETAREATQRADLLTQLEPYAGLPDVVLERHRDVLAVAAAQADTLLALLERSASALEVLADDAGELQVVRPAWSVDTLVHYLLRD